MRVGRGQHVAKGKKKKNKDKKVKKKAASAATRTGAAAGKAAKGLKSLSQNPLVADIVAAALVATASALKDAKKARRLASEAGDELTKLSKSGAKRGGALWDMALQIGRESLDALSREDAPKRAKSKPRATKRPAKRAPAKRTPR